VPDHLKFYIDGVWVDAATAHSIAVINPANENTAGHVSEGSRVDVDRAAAAARKAFSSWSNTTREERLDLLGRIIDEYKRREADIADAITLEMGAPTSLARGGQTKSGLAHFEAAITVLQDYPFEKQRGTTCIRKEAIGVCGLITPWNWPLNQIACKVAPALATGCTMILKPSEVAPFSAIVFAEILHAAGVPSGVFNLVNGGAQTGSAIASHPDVDMVSFTGSTRGGIAVAIAAASTVKRVAQELGGKSPIILLPGADFPKAVAAGLKQVMNNSGQSCNAPTRMLVPANRMEEVADMVREEIAAFTVGDPAQEVTMGPVVSEIQWRRIQKLIETGVAEGARLVAGGPGKPEGLAKGYYVQPTVFADVTPEMTIAREEIFGPVLSIMGYLDSEDAVRIANDTEYGLAAYLWGDVHDDLPAIARRLRAGRISINGSAGDIFAPFGGYKMSGNGREWGEYGFDEFVELKAVLGVETKIL